MTKHKTATGSSKKPLVPEYLTPEPQGSVTAENVPDPTTVVALIGQEQRLMNLWVEGGTRALAEILEVPEDVLAKRWNRIKNHSSFIDGYLPMEARVRCLPPLEPIVEALEKYTHKTFSDLDYTERDTLIMMPRPDLGWVSLAEYARINESYRYLEVAGVVIKKYCDYKKLPRYDLDPEISKSYQVLPGTVFSRYTGKTLRFGRKYREAHKHLLAYPRTSARTHRVVWNKPETYEGEKYYPVEAIRGFTQPYGKDDWKVLAGEQGGYVKEYDNLEPYSWVADTAHVKGKVSDGSLVAGNAYIGEYTTVLARSIISGDVRINRKTKVAGSNITGEVTIGTKPTLSGEELTLYYATVDGKVTIDDNVKCIAQATISGDIEINGDLTIANNISLTGSMTVNSTGGYELYDSLKGELDHKGNKPVFELRNGSDRRQHRSMGYYQQKPPVD